MEATIPTTNPMCTYFSTIEDVRTAKEINGISITEIESRARPDKWAQTGFIGQYESLQSVIEKDWITVQAAGLTHVLIAKHLRAITAEPSADNLQPIKRDGQRPEYYPCQYNPVSFERKSLECKKHSSKVVRDPPEADIKAHHLFIWFLDITVLSGIALSFAMLATTQAIFSSIAVGILGALFLQLKSAPAPTETTIDSYYPEAVSQPSVSLTIELHGFKGGQEDIFSDKIEGFHCGWSRDFVITNHASEEAIRIAEGVIDYIEKYGFYEGGSGKNPFRVDPEKLIRILNLDQKNIRLWKSEYEFDSK